MQKEFLAAFAIALTFIAFYPYIHSVRNGTTRPHVFSWIIWGSTTFIVFLAQLSAKGGAGAWPTGISGIITLYVAVLAWQRKADTIITRADSLFFLAAMSALPLWYLTSDPLWAVLVLTGTDLLGFGPTFRKAWHEPFAEQRLFFILMVMRNLVALMALEHYSLTTTLFPAIIAMACLVFILMVQYRRQVTTKKDP